jgi:hypothetical protein
MLRKKQHDEAPEVMKKATHEEASDEPMQAMHQQQILITEATR